MKIGNRFYLDHNASSPLSFSVRDFLAKGDLFFGNPSSRHLTGQKSESLISKTTQKIKEIFDPTDSYHVVFHSGATEGINGVFRFWRDSKTSAGVRGRFHYLLTDHAIAHKLALSFPQTKAHPNIEGLLLEDFSDAQNFVNWSWVNNETGEILNLDLAQKLKEKFGEQIFLSVDGAQALARSSNGILPSQLPVNLDAYHFSGHKFGALTGVGFSLLSKKLQAHSWSEGGGQNPWRSGSLNTLGIYSLHLSLQDLFQFYRPEKMKEVCNQFERFFEQEMPWVKNLSFGFEQRSLNTLFICFSGVPNDRLLTAFSLAGIDLSAGSACSSGSSRPNHVALALGCNEIEAKEVLRISWDYRLDPKELPELINLFRRVLLPFGPRAQS